MQGKVETRRTGSTRREIMTAAGASALALSVGAGLSNPPVMATGRVFEDRNGSGRREPRATGASPTSWYRMAATSCVQMSTGNGASPSKTATVFS